MQSLRRARHVGPPVLHLTSPMRRMWTAAQDRAFATNHSPSGRHRVTGCLQFEIGSPPARVSMEPASGPCSRRDCIGFFKLSWRQYFSNRYVLPERGVVDQTPENIPETTFGYHNETTEENAGESGRAPPIITQRVFRPLANLVLVQGLTGHVTDRCTCRDLPDRPGEP